ncbi:MAG: TetR/AcrR family transcriptional regulator [Balneolaceae bacterium]|nr:TetR/AcrR family transcriptional regulator [Balneolaceae bacterium]
MKLTRKERERIARRELIIDAAENLIDRLGIDNITMDTIATEAEVGKGTLYLHFKSKKSIYLAISERGSRLLNHAFGKALLKELPGLKLIEELGRTYLKFVQENPVYFTVFNYYESLINDDDLAQSELAQRCEESAREAMTYIVRALQIGMQDGSINNKYDPHELGIVIWGASRGVIHMAFHKQKKHHMKILDDVNFSLQSLVSNFIELIGTGMANDQRSKNN